MIMLAVIVCLAGIDLILMVAEILWRRKILRGEYQRKFVHITAGTFIAFWPWLISFRSIQLIGLAMLAGILFVQAHKMLHFTSDPGRVTYGFVFFAVAVILISLLTNNRLFFALAILNMSLADGFAAIVGQKYGKNWEYYVFSHTKTVIGSMTFWLVSLGIFGIGLLFSPAAASHYLALLLFLPPLLTIAENVPGVGSDNIFVPLAAILVLNLAAKY
jgi:dolichol kinase